VCEFLSKASCFVKASHPASLRYRSLFFFPCHVSSSSACFITDTHTRPTQRSSLSFLPPFHVSCVWVTATEFSNFAAHCVLKNLTRAFGEKKKKKNYTGRQHPLRPLHFDLCSYCRRHTIFLEVNDNVYARSSSYWRVVAAVTAVPVFLISAGLALQFWGLIVLSCCVLVEDSLGDAGIGCGFSL
jgi:hypothetical protein